MANYSPTPLDFGDFTSIPLFSDVAKQIRDDDWSDQEIAEYVRSLIALVVDGKVPNDRTYVAAVLKSNLSSITGSMRKQCANKRRKKKPTQDGQPYGNPKPEDGNPSSQHGIPSSQHGNPSSEHGSPNRMEWNENENGNGNENPNLNLNAKQQPSLSLVEPPVLVSSAQPEQQQAALQEEVVETYAYPVPKRTPKPAKPEQQQAAMQSYVQENGLGYLQKAVGAAAFEDMVRSREYNPFDAQLEKAAEEEAALDSAFDHTADMKYDASLVTPSTILPCMTHAQISPNTGNLWDYPDAEGKKHFTPLGALLTNYHQRTGKTDYSSFQRSIKVNCPVNCQGTQKQMHQCWDCVHKALSKWDKTKSPTPHRLIGKIIQDERGF